MAAFRDFCDLCQARMGEPGVHLVVTRKVRANYHHSKGDWLRHCEDRVGCALRAEVQRYRWKRGGPEDALWQTAAAGLRSYYALHDWPLDLEGELAAQERAWAEGERLTYEAWIARGWMAPDSPRYAAAVERLRRSEAACVRAS